MRYLPLNKMVEAAEIFGRPVEKLSELHVTGNQISALKSQGFTTIGDVVVAMAPQNKGSLAGIADRFEYRLWEGLKELGIIDLTLGYDDA